MAFQLHPVLTAVPESALFGYGRSPPYLVAPPLRVPPQELTPPMYAGFGNSYSATSDSSSASSPDIQSLLPPRHRWTVPTPPQQQAPWFPPVQQQAAAAAAYDGGFDGMPPPIPPPMAASNIWHNEFEDQTSSEQYPTASRHHPYLAESSMDAHRRALAGAAVGASSMGPGGLRMGADDQRPPAPPKSGRLGVKRRQKYTRSRTGCLGCRARRIKCDEGRPVCRRCQVAKRECCFPDPNEAKKPKRNGQQSESDNDDDKYDGSGSVENTTPPTATTDLTFELSQAVPEGFGIGGEPLGWDRAFSRGLSPSAMGFDPIAAGLDLIAAAPTAGALASLVEGKDKWADGETPLLSTPNFLLPWFPTAQEQSLILHYCANAADLMMAIPSSLNPMLAINLPLALESPRGMNPAADALRVTLLGIGAVHQAFLLARSGMNTVQTTATFQYAANLRDMAKQMVCRALDDPAAAASDAALSAATSLATIDIFFGGEHWLDNFAVAKRLVAQRGGPARMLKASTPTQLADGVTATPARLLLEMLAIYETLGCLTLGQEPELISESENWWFEKSSSTYDEHSVETLFGMSKVMVHLFSRISRLLARVAKQGRYLEEPPKTTTRSANIGPEGFIHIDSSSTGLLPANVLPNIFQSPTGTAAPPQASRVGSPLDDGALHTEAANLNTDIDAWIQSLQNTQVVPVEHERVQVGNKAYASTMKILLLRMAYGRRRGDPEVQEAAQEVLQHCSVSTAALGMSIDLMWPAVIAGCEVDGGSRQWLLTLLEGFKAQCCFDVETASRIIQEVWRRVDTGEPRAEWKAVCDDLGLKVLLC
ncbi:uncharacterized protein EHS24_002041 [Apiotrichum porosum]|uniref:Zn(2)-C6 fungal-type domain-containing protein n=1 Tax=Apiotrichum porosum TaxID=105984 RepID=A0A427XHL8_9TREE|nr:uncharacterized protein EHS24_002041 [Apiotrichum porosum]RSH78322.1 hypothetical protein EHS24_002041 [Apiotrichum porosum]